VITFVCTAVTTLTDCEVLASRWRWFASLKNFALVRRDGLDEREDIYVAIRTG
jgi:hypothetical protein